MCKSDYDKSFLVGEIVMHSDGRKVRIVGGAKYGEIGMNDFWYWQEVYPDGFTSLNIEYGYGKDLRKIDGGV